MAVSMGTANAIPTLPWPLPPPVSICELIPITLPAASSSGPPELPGLIGASVWITLSMLKPSGGLDLTLERGDDPAGQRAVEPERVADREGGIPDLDGSGIPELGRADGRHATHVDSQHCEVVAGIRTDHPSLTGDVVLELSTTIVWVVRWPVTPSARKAAATTIPPSTEEAKFQRTAPFIRCSVSNRR